MLLIVLILVLIALWVVYYDRRKEYCGGASDEYPYRRKFMTMDDVMSAFEKIKECRFEFIDVPYKVINMPNTTPKFKGKQTICQVNDSYESMNWLSDWFNEKCRLACKRYDEELSPLDYFDAHKGEIKLDNLRMASDEIYNKVRGCNNFRPGLLVSAINYFGARKILDFSAGWGDRLIGAIAAGVEYVGVDPNPCLHPGYDEIINTLAADKSKYTMIKAPFQTVDLGTHMFDFVFTSPPYFDLEVYTNEPGQSIIDHKNVDDWFDKFLMVSLNKSWTHLLPGGTMIIIINDIRAGPKYPSGIQYVNKMVERMSTQIDALFLGALSYAELKNNKPQSPQPMWIWTKMRPALFDEKLQFAKIQDRKNLAHFGLAGALVNVSWDNVPDKGWCICSVDSINQDISAATDSISYGAVYLDYIEYLVWQKKLVDVNPKIITTDIKIELNGTNKTLIVVRDDMLPGGTKQRGASVINKISNNEIVYAGPWNGFAQVALSIACKKYSKKATIFMSRDDYKTNVRAKQFGGNIIVIKNADLKTLQNEAKQYAEINGAYLMPFGFDDDDFKTELYNNIISALTISRDFSKTIWLVAGSGTLANVLAKVFPVAKFVLVQVGKKIWPDQIDEARMRVIVASEKFFEPAKYQPPYTSTETYDAKLWQFARDAEDGDMIWNVAGHEH